MDPAGKPAISQAARRTVDLRFVELMDKVRRNRPGDDLELLRRAYDFAAGQHKTQTRLSGEPFLSHPVEVAHILAWMWRGWSKARRRSAGWTCWRPKRGRRKTFARCCWRW